MTWLLAMAMVAAAFLALAGISTRSDPKVGGRMIAPPGRVPGRKSLPSRTDRHLQFEASSTELFDLVSVTVGAGLSPAMALERAAAALPGRLGRTLEEARRQVALGDPWRTAIRGIAERTGDRDLRRLAVILDRGDRLGTPLAEGLRALAGQVREERRVDAEEQARRAPVLMLFPLVFCILPAFLLSALVPALLVAARGAP